jgi:hypothetical protein
MTRDRASRGSDPAPEARRSSAWDGRSLVRPSYPGKLDAASRRRNITPADDRPAGTKRSRHSLGTQGGDA